ERQGPASEVAKGRKRRSGTPPTRSGCALLVDHFTSAAAARPAGRQRPQGRQVARSGDGSVGAASAAVVTSTLLEKLRRNVLRKRLDWQQMPSSALPLPSGGSVMDTFVCSAPERRGDDVAVPQREVAVSRIHLYAAHRSGGVTMWPCPNARWQSDGRSKQRSGAQGLRIRLRRNGN
ncbi:helicase, partial [Trypanosoma cruzi]